MKTIPTAEEFFLLDKNWGFAGKQVHQKMIEFAKLHVEAAIKECIESAPSGSSTDTVSFEDVFYALKDCYPINNIK